MRTRGFVTSLIILVGMAIGCTLTGSGSESDLLDGTWVMTPVTGDVPPAYTLELEQSGEEVGGTARRGAPPERDSIVWDVSGTVSSGDVNLAIINPSGDTARYDGRVTESDFEPSVEGELRFGVSQGTYYLEPSEY